MTRPTPSYDPALMLEIYGKASTILNQIHAMSPLPFGQFATDSDTNMDIWQRHRDLLAKAGDLKGELFELVAETSRLAIKRRTG